MNPGGLPINLLTVCFSMYSLMSIRIISFSFPKYVSARVLHNSVLPTPVGPQNIKLAIGRDVSRRPERARRTALATARTALCWPFTLPSSSDSSFMRRSDSLVSNLPTGTLVISETTCVMVCSVTCGCWLLVPSKLLLNEYSMCTNAPASSNKSIALSGRNRSEIYRSLSVAAASKLSSVNLTPWYASYFGAMAFKIPTV
mmetsp:Transcript_11669/g.17720  ORF Transcript_11669/g.17720 Transcript_11669/m.17720 type:complete len:200 (-) Transcript_11669:702-1301(-)